MISRRFTIVCEFRGTTNVSQVQARDQHAAVRAWAIALRAGRPFDKASAYLARAAEARLETLPPVALDGIENVWCVSGTCGGDLWLANIVETA